MAQEVAFYEFTHEERRNLALCWVNEDQQKISDFISDCEFPVRMYLHRLQEVQTKNSEKVARYVKIIKATKSLKREIEILPKDCKDILSAISQSKLFCDQEFATLKNVAKKFCMAEYPDIKKLDRVISSLLKLIIVSSEEAANFTEKKSGRDKRQEEFFVGLMVNAYVSRFNKLPGKSKDGPFHKFVSQIASIVKSEIGADTINRSIDLFSR